MNAETLSLMPRPRSSNDLKIAMRHVSVHDSFEAFVFSYRTIANDPHDAGQIVLDIRIEQSKEILSGVR